MECWTSVCFRAGFVWRVRFALPQAPPVGQRFYDGCETRFLVNPKISSDPSRPSTNSGRVAILNINFVSLGGTKKTHSHPNSPAKQLATSTDQHQPRLMLLLRPAIAIWLVSAFLFHFLGWRASLPGSLSPRRH